MDFLRDPAAMTPAERLTELAAIFRPENSVAWSRHGPATGIRPRNVELWARM